MVAAEAIWVLGFAHFWGTTSRRLSISAWTGTETAFYDQAGGHDALGLVKTLPDGTAADHNSIQDSSQSGGDPAGELGYATAWLEYQLLGSSPDGQAAAKAFTGSFPELDWNSNWPGSATK